MKKQLIFSVKKVVQLLKGKNIVVTKGTGKEEQIRRAKKLKNIESV